jgi:hypothetical protein
MTDSQLLFALADFGFMINLFTMLPLGSMDGGLSAGRDPLYSLRETPVRKSDHFLKESGQGEKARITSFLPRL